MGSFRECCREQIARRDRAVEIRDEMFEADTKAIEDTEERLDDAKAEARRKVEQALQFRAQLAEAGESTETPADVEAEARRRVQEALDQSEAVNLLRSLKDDQLKRRRKNEKLNNEFILDAQVQVERCRQDFDAERLCYKGRPECCKQDPGGPGPGGGGGPDATLETDTVASAPTTGAGSQVNGSFVPTIPEELQPSGGPDPGPAFLTGGVGTQDDTVASVAAPPSPGSVGNITGNFGPISGPQSNPSLGQFVGSTVFDGQGIAGATILGPGGTLGPVSLGAGSGSDDNQGGPTGTLQVDGDLRL